MTFKFFTPFESMTYSEMTEVGRFLEKHLDEYFDSFENIFKSIQSAIKQRPSFGGFVITAVENQQTIGAIVINSTGMDGYAPQNIVVYLAVHRNKRRKGVGQQLLQKAIETAKGDIAIHLNPDLSTEALSFYNALGFHTAAIELRLSRNEQDNKNETSDTIKSSKLSLHQSN